MTQTQSLSISKAEAIKIGLGILALSMLAQIKFYLPFSPVPVTGQTFGVALLALTYGRKLSSLSVLAYLVLGAAGLPIFTGLSAGFSGLTSGYLLGMLVSSFVVGGLADKGAKNSFTKSLAATYAGSLCVFSFGVLGLSLFVPVKELLWVGIFPFLAGDLVKNMLAATIATKFLNK